MASVLAGPHIVFRSSALGAHYGQLAAVPLGDPAGARASLGLTCERTYATKTAGACLFAKRGVVQTYGITMLDAQLRPTGDAELVGLPSRVRMSADSSLIATTTFVGGHSYAQASFSTETIIRRDGKSLGNIESWKSTVDGRPLRSVDRNFWGVTFADDDDTFYATAASGSTTWLMRGSLKTKSMISLRTDAECPSLSPDQTKIAYKKRLDNKARGVWRLAVLDLRTGQESLLAETRSVDDQVEWLDDARAALRAVSARLRGDDVRRLGGAGGRDRHAGCLHSGGVFTGGGQVIRRQTLQRSWRVGAAESVRSCEPPRLCFGGTDLDKGSPR